jgi:hypothetical protein
MQTGSRLVYSLCSEPNNDSPPIRRYESLIFTQYSELRHSPFRIVSSPVRKKL